ncbi:MAG TPA: hypothetical protein VFP68_23285 [Burkholderiaceae bacterium]|nr:hypothetical protein [Burkholderiaceae bacterium]
MVGQWHGVKPGGAAALQGLEQRIVQQPVSHSDGFEAVSSSGGLHALDQADDLRQVLLDDLPLRLRGAFRAQGVDLNHLVVGKSGAPRRCDKLAVVACGHSPRPGRGSEAGGNADQACKA